MKESKTMEIEKYQEAVEHIAENHKNVFFENRGSDHASIVLANLIRHSKEEVKIFTEKLDDVVFSLAACEDSLEDFINKSEKKMQVLLEKQPEVMSSALKKVMDAKKKYPSRFQIKIATQECLDAMHETFEGMGHFALADNSSYRIEVDCKNFKAICNFNDPKLVSGFSKLFSHFFNKAPIYSA
ncbi:MAG: hypothetical protein RRB13_14035 [bacterium]|nr:hypothetical protein [bacterium]